jgi:hypothetical protein
MSEKKELTFEEFAKMCEDAGIAAEPAEMEQDFRVGGVIADLVDELMGAMESFPAMNSAHEGFAVLKEEVDELWDEVKVKQGERNLENMRKEAIQVAAMAVRFAADICHDEKANN